MTMIYNRPKCYGSEWEAYVDDEATARGIHPKDWQALEALEEELYQENPLDPHIRKRAYELLLIELYS